MDAQWQHTNGAYSRYYSQNQMGQQSLSGVNPAGSDTKHQCQQASSVGPGTGAKHEWVNCFDDFYSDVFLNDFENVDLAKYNVVCTLEMQGGWYSVPSSTTSVYSSVITPSTYSGWNNPPTSLPTLTSDKLYLKGGLPPSLTREHFPPGAHEPPLGHLQTIGGEHPQGHLQTVAGEHPQGHLQTVAGEHPQGHLQTVAGEHPQGHLQTVAGEHPQGHLQTVAGEHPQGHLQTIAGEHPQGHLQTVAGEHPQGHLQTVAGEHPQGHLQTIAGEHPQGHLQTVAGEHPQGHLQTVAGEHPQGHLQTIAGEQPQGHLQTVAGEHPQGHLQTVAGEHPQGHLQTVAGEHPQGHLQTVAGEHPQGNLQTVAGEHPQGHLQTVAGEHPQGHLQTVAGEHPQGHLQTVAGEHPQGHLQTVAGEHPQGHLQTVAGEHPQGHLQTIAGEHPQGHLQTVAGEHPQGHLQTVAGEHPQGHLQTVAGEHPQGHLQTVAGEHPQGYLQTVAGEHPQGHLQTVAGEHPLGYLQTVAGEHTQGHQQTVAGEHPLGYLQTIGREHPQGNLQTVGGEHPQGHLQTVGGERPKHVSQLAQDRVVGAPQLPEEEKVFSTLGQRLNLGTRCHQNADVVFLQTSSTNKLSGLTKAGSGLPEAGSTLPSISIIINTYDEKGESAKACQFDSTENLVSDGSVGDVTSSEDHWQTTASTYVSLSSSSTSGPTSSDHVSSSSDSKDSSKHVRNREVRRAVDEPRRPKNGFIRFSIEHRQQIAVKHPRLDNREISRMLGCKWRKLSNEEKKPYEVEFEKDIQAIREVNPEWRYAPARQLVEELIEPMPSRLRPRNSLKRKKLPSLVRTYSRRQNSGKSSKTSRKKLPAVQSEMLDPAATPLSVEDPSTTWVQCDLCGKWRCLPGFIQPEALCDIWFCYFNPDNRYNSCSIKEELDPDDASAPPHLPVPPNSTCTAYSGGHVLSREPSW